jgi:hypothetical protein
VEGDGLEHLQVLELAHLVEALDAVPVEIDDFQFGEFQDRLENDELTGCDDWRPRTSCISVIWLKEQSSQPSFSGNSKIESTKASTLRMLRSLLLLSQTDRVRNFLCWAPRSGTPPRRDARACSGPVAAIFSL